MLWLHAHDGRWLELYWVVLTTVERLLSYEYNCGFASGSDSASERSVAQCPTGLVDLVVFTLGIIILYLSSF